MAEDSKNDLRDQLLAMAKSIRKVVEMISAPEDPKADDVSVIPETFLCPLTQELMIDPVMLSSGYTYDRSGIEVYLEAGFKICPMAQAPLVHSKVTPNHLARVLIRDWCKQHNKSNLIQYSDSTPLYIRQEYFDSLHTKLLSSDKKEAAQELRKEVTEKSYFRKLYAETSQAIPHLLAPLSRSDTNSKIDPHIQEDLITTLMILSVNEKVKKVIAETPEAVCFLVDALRSENVETQRNAALTFFQLSSIDSNKEIIGTREAIVGMATLLIEETSAFFLKDVAAALFRIFDNDKNKEIAVKNRVLAAIFQKIEENECVDIMLPILANLSTIEEGVSEMENFDCFHLLRVIRGSLSAKDKETGTVIISNVLKKDGSKWKDLVTKEEVFNGTLSDIFENGTWRAKGKAEETLDMLKLEM